MDTDSLASKVFAKTVNPSHAAAQKAIWLLAGEKPSWTRVSEKLGFSRGYLFLVAHGERKPSRRLLRKLRLTPSERYEANCAAYDIWRPSVEPAVQAMLLACEEREACHA
jgi:hypothetical protein